MSCLRRCPGATQVEWTHSEGANIHLFAFPQSRAHMLSCSTILEKGTTASAVCVKLSARLFRTRGCTQLTHHARSPVHSCPFRRSGSDSRVCKTSSLPSRNRTASHVVRRQKTAAPLQSQQRESASSSVWPRCLGRVAPSTTPGAPNLYRPRQLYDVFLLLLSVVVLVLRDHGLIKVTCGRTTERREAHLCVLGQPNE